VKDLHGKLVWITGASSGIGESLSRQFAHLGCRLVLSSRRESELQRVASSCTGAQGIFVIPLDLSKPETMSIVAQRVLADIGPVDIMVHNGGVSQRADARETIFEVDNVILRTNYLGPIALTKALLPSMLARKQGHFVVVTSALGKFSIPTRSAYCASKHALHGFFDAMRAESWKDGIAVTLAVPGFVRTNVGLNALTGTGLRFGREENEIAKGLNADHCASRIISAARREQHEVFIGSFKERIALTVSHVAPRLFFHLTRKK
jgi:dehydrogenase/reductase SDR family protein 7B